MYFPETVPQNPQTYNYFVWRIFVFVPISNMRLIYTEVPLPSLFFNSAVRHTHKIFREIVFYLNIANVKKIAQIYHRADESALIIILYAHDKAKKNGEKNKIKNLFQSS